MFTGKVCDMNVASQLAPTPALFGIGNSREDCLLACYKQRRCVYFNFNSATGTCDMFQQCTRHIAIDVSVVATYVRSVAVHGDSFSIKYEAGQLRCDYHNASQRAMVNTLIGRGHELVECVSTCYTHSDCNYFVFTPTGYCHMFSSCDTKTRSKTATTYVRRAYMERHALHDVSHALLSACADGYFHHFHQIT